MCAAICARGVIVLWKPFNPLTYHHYLILVTTVALDQATKHIAFAFMHALPWAATPWCNIVLLWNPGVIFGITLFDQPIAYTVLTVGISCFVLYMLCRTKCPKERLAFTFILAGAIGNIIDRLRFGAVIDFIDLHVGGHHWPAFNIADAAISCSVLWLGLQFLKKPL